MTKLLALAFFALTAHCAAPVACTTAPCSFSTNVAWTTKGTPDPNFWGNSAAVTTAVPFSNVPKGYAVQIVHVSGDQIAAPGPNGTTAANGTVYAKPYSICVSAPSTISYVLFSLTNTTPANQTYSPLEQGAGFIFHQLEVPGTGSRTSFDNDVVPNAILNADNVLNVNQAMFLNTTGCPTHMELSLVITFKYVLSSGATLKKTTSAEGYITK